MKNADDYKEWVETPFFGQRVKKVNLRVEGQRFALHPKPPLRLAKSRPSGGCSLHRPAGLVCKGRWAKTYLIFAGGVVQKNVAFSLKNIANLKHFYPLSHKSEICDSSPWAQGEP